MTEQTAQVSVRILDKEYQVACPASERTNLLDSAEILNAKMREIRDSGRIVGLDRIAVMAALNMANDLIHANARDQELEGGISHRLKVISDRVDHVLSHSQQLDL
ncbi:MAG: cell division protein ZapA [Gammaproteobacteria bacterium]|jgi:cell division protein ZapA|nr:cell division protein ZapA [Gammaproteobacteria bacterium]MDH5239811.1 cell division protein ZapA [Gammaproteobacteria bacterium]MDH5261393.1 cell division protein ZapA [Gammaproteobacteria bacterium]MDH5582964.1 cell division protein ZapA [Gammaproteobacteria bacterium]